MSLIHKSLVFALFILLLQFLVFGGLLLSLSQTQRKTEEVSYSHRAVTACSQLDIGYNQAVSDLISLAITGNNAFATRYDQVAAQLRERIEQLRNEKLASAQDRLEIEQMSRCTAFILHQLDQFRQNNMMKPSPTHLHTILATIRLEIQPYLTDGLEAMRRFSARHAAVEGSVKAELDTSQLIQRLVASVFVVNVASTLLIIFGFSRGVVRRLSIVADNFSRFGAKRVLHAVQKGDDEISLLDRQFHNLCDALSEASAKEQAVFENLPVGLMSCREENVIENVNPKIEQLIGPVSAGTKVYDLLMNEAIDTAKMQQLITAKNTSPMRLRFKSEDQQGFPGEVTVSHFQHRGEQKLLVAVLDVSEREEIEKLRQEFVNIVSHDIRSPLTSIDAFLTLFDKGILGELNAKGEKQLSRAKQEIDRLMKLTSDLLDLARIEAGNVLLNRSTCSVWELMDHAVESVRPSADLRHLTMQVQPTELTVFADSDRVLQILINYLSNAIKYSGENQQIRVYAESTERSVRISVQDQGCGVPESFQKGIFERFKQVNRSDEKQGTGLGLAICRLLAEAHGGTVGVNSSPGEGSTFWLELPTELSPHPDSSSPVQIAEAQQS